MLGGARAGARKQAPVGRWAAGVCLAVMGGCGEPLDTTRQIPERGTLGEEIHRLLHRDLVRTDPPRAEAFAAERAPFAAAIDHLFPEPELEATQAFFEALLPLFDDGTLPELSREAAALLDRLAADDEALQAMAVVLNREGYLGAGRLEAVLRGLLDPSDFDPALRGLLDWVALYDGRAGASDLLPRMGAALGERFVALAPSTDRDRAIVRLVELATLEAPEFDRGTSVWGVRRDVRGVAEVAAGGSGQLPSRFVDLAPADGLADLDGLGRFLSPEGRALILPPFAEGPGRDPEGRPMLDGEGLAFRYADLSASLGAALMRDGRALAFEAPYACDEAADPTCVDFLSAAIRLGIELLAPPADPGPLTELAHAAARAVPPGAVMATLELAEVALDPAREPTTAGALLELEAAGDVLDRYPDVALEPDNRLLDEGLAWARRLMAEPGLAEALLDILLERRMDGLPETIEQLAGHRKALITETDYRRQTVFTEPVDRSQPDTMDNQSIQQRMLHLIADTRGVFYEPELIGVPLGFVFEIDDLASFYLLSIIGETEVPSLVATVTGLSRRPTPIELAAFINEDQLFGNPVGKDGVEVRHNDGDTLFAVSASGMDRVLEPVIRLFYDRGRMDLLLDGLELLHRHWASPEGGAYQSQSTRQPRYSALSGIARFEPLLVELLIDTELYASARQLLAELRPETLDGQPSFRRLVELARHAIRIDASLRTRSGSSEVVWGDVRRTALSPMDLLLAGLERLDERLSGSRSLERDRDAVFDGLGERFLGVERTGPLEGRFQRTDAPVAVRLVLGRLKAWAQEIEDLDGFVRGEMVQDLADVLTDPMVPLATETMEGLLEPGPWRAPLGRTARRMMDARFDDLLVVGSDLLGALQDQALSLGALHAVGRELSDDFLLASQAVALAERALATDDQIGLGRTAGDHFVEVARRALEPRTEGGVHLYGVLNAVAQTQRVVPGAEGALDVEDLRRVVNETRDFLLDEEGGLEKYFELVEERTLAGRAARAEREAAR